MDPTVFQTFEKKEAITLCHSILLVAFSIRVCDINVCYDMKFGSILYF